MLNYNSGWIFLLLALSNLLLLAVMLVSIYYFRAVWLLRGWTWYRIWRTGLKKQHLKITDKLQISYLERKGDIDNGHILLFVHGFTGDKAIFCDVVRYLPKKFHVILIDLPGHGESKPDDDESDYKPSALVDSVHQFVKAHGLGEKKLCIIGSSLGGAIAGIYAARYGDESLSSAVLVCPAGIHSPVLSEFLLKVRDDLDKNVEDNLLLPKTAQELNDMLQLVMYHKLNIPLRIAMAFVELKQRKAKVHKKVLRDMNTESEYLLLDNALEEIQHPVLCVWGEDDKIVHVSGSDVIKQRVKNAEVHVLDRCGHAITLDRPRKLVKVITQFLEKVATT